jgi:hypothetical protein
MLYAIIDNDTIAATGRARDLWPDVSFPVTGPREDWLAKHGAVLIRNDPPHNSETHYLQPAAPYLLDGVVYSREAVPIPEPEPVPQWVAFAGALAIDPQVNQLVGTLAQAAPVLHLQIGVGLGQAAKGDPQTFLAAWNAGLATGLVSKELAAHVVGLARPFDLPADFVAALER